MSINKLMTLPQTQYEIIDQRSYFLKSAAVDYVVYGRDNEENSISVIFLVIITGSSFTPF